MRFDRAVDRASVVARFHVEPRVTGEVRWKNSNTLVFEHPALSVDRDYTVVLESGFRDQAGVASQFRHSWRFHTEGPPVALSSTPSNRDRGVDPASYLSIGFNHQMDPKSFVGAVTVSPSTPYMVRLDPSDPRRVVIAPRSLLEPGTHYSLAVTAQATDADGNHVPVSEVVFDTGPVRSLQHWITFIASDGSAAPGAGIWMVDEARFPRLLTDAAVDSFSWGPSVTSLLVHRSSGGWALLTPGGKSVNLPFEARWAAYLGPDLGYAYLSGDSLERVLPDGQLEHVATGVGEVAVAPDLGRLAFTVVGRNGEIDGFDLALRARYVIVRDSGLINSLAWSPNGLRLAYLMSSGLSSRQALRVKSLAAGGAVITVASGDIATPAWLADSTYMAFSARLEGDSRRRIFRLNTALPSAPLSAQQALASSLPADASDPRPSPDGHQIAFLSATPAGGQIWLMNADGTGLQNLTRFDPDNFPYTGRSLHWGA